MPDANALRRVRSVPAEIVEGTRTSGTDDDLPELASDLESLVGVLRPVERERLLDRNGELAAGDELAETAHDVRLLLSCAGAQHRAVDAAALPHQLVEVDLGAASRPQ